MCFLLYAFILLFFNISSAEFVYGKKEAPVQRLDSYFYAKAVENLPIICVDVFIFNLETSKFLLGRRTCDPAKYKFWFVGGRLYKNESFFDCAKRKSFEESKLNIEPVCILDVYSLIFDKSAWNCSTHTPSIVVLGLCRSSMVESDTSHDNFKWVDLSEVQEDKYIENVRKKAEEMIKINLKLQTPHYRKNEVLFR